MDLLIIAGNPNEEELQQAWVELKGEYSEAIKTDKSNSIFACWKKINVIQFKLYAVTMLCEVLKEGYDEQLALELANLGYDYIQNLEDRESYLRQIYLVQQESKNMIIFLNQYTAEYEALCPADSPTIERDRMSYEKEISVLSKFMGYYIRKEEVSVFEFCSIVNTYLESFKKQLD